MKSIAALLHKYTVWPISLSLLERSNPSYMNSNIDFSLRPFTPLRNGTNEIKAKATMNRIVKMIVNT